MRTYEWWNSLCQLQKRFLKICIIAVFQEKNVEERTFLSDCLNKSSMCLTKDQVL